MANKRPIILCLINAAAYSRSYFAALEPHLAKHGYDVWFALDSHLSDVLYSDGNPLPNASYFSDFCKDRGARNGQANSEEGGRTWSMFLSDFDRFLTMDIRPPLQVGSGLQFSQIPGLLDDFFESVFRSVQPAAVLYEQVSNSFAIAANDRAMRAGIPFCSIAPSRLPGRIEVSMTGALRDHVTLKEYYKDALRQSVSPSSWETAREYMRTVEEAVPDYMKVGQAGWMLANASLRARYLKREKFTHLARAWRYRSRHRSDAAIAYQHGDPILLSWAYFRRALARRIRFYRIRQLYRQAPTTDRYFLYPLHFHPEASTSVLAPDFIDEMHVIMSIAFRLPVGVRLVVKEHPSAVALQPFWFYQKLSRLPNVDLVAANISAKQLARKSAAVVTVTGTLGFEAAVMNRPVICLGDVLYGYFPNVKMISDLSQLNGAIEWALRYEPVPDQSILAALAAYAEFTDPGAFDFRASARDSAALANMAAVLAARLAASYSASRCELANDLA